MNRAQIEEAALLIDNVKELEGFLAKNKTEDPRPLYVTAMRSRQDTNPLGLKVPSSLVEDLLRPLATAMRVRLEDMGIE